MTFAQQYFIRRWSFVAILTVVVLFMLGGIILIDSLHPSVTRFEHRLMAFGVFLVFIVVSLALPNRKLQCPQCQAAVHQALHAVGEHCADCGTPNLVGEQVEIRGKQQLRRTNCVHCATSYNHLLRPSGPSAWWPAHCRACGFRLKPGSPAPAQPLSVIDSVVVLPTRWTVDSLFNPATRFGLVNIVCAVSVAAFVWVYCLPWSPYIGTIDVPGQMIWLEFLSMVLFFQFSKVWVRSERDKEARALLWLLRAMFALLVGFTLLPFVGYCCANDPVEFTDLVATQSLPQSSRSQLRITLVGRLGRSLYPPRSMGSALAPGTSVTVSGLRSELFGTYVTSITVSARSAAP